MAFLNLTNEWENFRRKFAILKLLKVRLKIFKISANTHTRKSLELAGHIFCSFSAHRTAAYPANYRPYVVSPQKTQIFLYNRQLFRTPAISFEILKMKMPFLFCVHCDKQFNLAPFFPAIGINQTGYSRCRFSLGKSLVVLNNYTNVNVYTQSLGSL